LSIIKKYIMTLKQQVNLSGSKLHSKHTLYASHRVSEEIYSVIDVTDGMATLRSEYNAKEVSPMKLDDLYNNYFGIQEDPNSFSI